MSAPRTLADLLRHRAHSQPMDRAYALVGEDGTLEADLSFGALAARAEALASVLVQKGRPGDRALLVFPNGPEFMVGLLGCVLAGLIAVPMMLPRRVAGHDASREIIRDCDPRLVITQSSLLEAPSLRAALVDAGVVCDFVATDSVSGEAGENFPAIAPHDVALLQYTSGSTSAPKGVMLNHASVLANLAMMARAFGNHARSTVVSWVPLYHDMGLFGNALQALFLGSACVLMRPATFLQRPLSWLAAISQYRAEFAGGPNFAFDHCVDSVRHRQPRDLDLSSWRVAFNGAEPVHADTLDRFSRAFAPYGFDRKAFYPCYGMAEATVMLSGGVRGQGATLRPVSRIGLRENKVAPPESGADSLSLVGCGHALAGEELAIVDPQSRNPLPPGSIGEVWARGPNVGSGYWRKPESTTSTFKAQRTDGEDGWMRTGDLGFMDAQGETFITGRVKDVIVIRGINHYPQDIERTVERSHPALRRHGGAAFSVLDNRDNEQLVVMQEVQAAHLRRIDIDDVEGAIREAVAEAHGVATYRIELLKPNSIPRTTSGKVQRAKARSDWERGLAVGLKPSR